VVRRDEVGRVMLFHDLRILRSMLVSVVLSKHLFGVYIIPNGDRF
jgi:hypothetical protein